MRTLGGKAIKIVVMKNSVDQKDLIIELPRTPR